MFVDGIPQPTYLEKTNGETFRESAYMHYFALSYRERKEFYVVFKPITGEIGERVGLIAGAILRPDFMPTDVSEPFFFPFHNLITTFPAEISINAQTQASFIADTDFELQPILQEILDTEQYQFEREGLSDWNLDDWLESRTRIGIMPYGSDIQLNYEGIITAKDGEVNLSVLIYGGKAIRSRITFFVNHQQVAINGNAHFIEVEIETGKALLLDVTLSLDHLEDFNALYVMMMATGNDFHDQDIFKARTVLLVNE